MVGRYIWVISVPVYHSKSFSPVSLATPEALEVTPSSASSLRVRWQPAAGATQYMALYSALTGGEPDDAKEVSLS